MCIELVFLENVLINKNELCRDHNWLTISDEFKCRRTAKRIFGDNIYFLAGSFSEFPKGCINVEHDDDKPDPLRPYIIVYNKHHIGSRCQDAHPHEPCSPICWTGRKSKYLSISL